MRRKKNNSARPATFNNNTAMLAIFGSFNEQHKGTLVPLKNTKSWNMKESDVLCTPILAATYTEGGIKKGVIAIQRQGILDGDVVDSHATAAEISVVDDNTTSREILTIRLTSWGIRPTEAKDGATALQYLYNALNENDPFQIAVIDM